MDKRGGAYDVMDVGSEFKSCTNKKMINNEPLPYLLPIHLITDLGTGVGYRVYLKG